MRGLVRTPSCISSGYGGRTLWQNGSWGVLCSLQVSSARSNDPIHGMKCTPQNTYDVISYASMYGEQSRLASIFAKNPQRRSQNPGTRFRRSTKFCETKSTCYAQTVRVDPKKLIYFFVVHILSTSQIYKYLPSTFLPFGHTTRAPRDRWRDTTRTQSPRWHARSSS